MRESRYKTNQECDILLKTKEQPIDNFVKTERNQYIIGATGGWFLSKHKSPLKELQFLDNKSPSGLLNELKLTGSRPSTMPDLKLIASYTGHTPKLILSEMNPRLFKAVVETSNRERLKQFLSFITCMTSFFYHLRAIAAINPTVGPAVSIVVTGGSLILGTYYTLLCTDPYSLVKRSMGPDELEEFHKGAEDIRREVCNAVLDEIIYPEATNVRPDDRYRHSF